MPVFGYQEAGFVVFDGMMKDGKGEKQMAARTTKILKAMIIRSERKLNRTERKLVGERSATENLVLAAMFLALGIIMPFLTGQIPGIGSRLLPMHIPVLICGYVCGWQYGLLVGFVVPILRSIMFGMPPMMPTAAAMAFELAAYGAVTGILYEKLPKSSWSVYVSLISAMIVGRIVWGLVCVPLYGLTGGAFTVQIFLAGGFLNAIPGIILQLVMIPVLVISLRRARVIM